MYVWEVKEDASYDGILWSVLIKDDENSLGKIKKEVIQYYNTSSIFESDKINGIAKINSITNLEDLLGIQMYLPFGRYSTIEVNRVELL